MISTRSMWISCAITCSLVAVVLSQGDEYLPPNKGYSYDKPIIPFPTNNNGNKQPTPTYRPATPTRPTYIPPEPTQDTGYPQNTKHEESHDHSHDHGDHHHHEPGMPFDFAYSVDENGNDFSHNAISDGDVTRGQYRVALPDGRTQIVKYTADWKNGFNAEVTYEGEAKYPEQTSGYGSGAPSGGQQYVPPSQGGGYQY